MCMIMYHPAGAKMPTKKSLVKMFSHNPHGFGVHVVGGDVYKTLDAAKMVLYVLGLSSDQEFLVHCRLATTGSVVTANCHPFFDPKTGCVFAHNGMIRIPAVGDHTDSETYFYKALLPALKGHKHLKKVPMLKQTQGSRLALYTPALGYKFAGIWWYEKKTGMWYSKYDSFMGDAQPVCREGFYRLPNVYVSLKDALQNYSYAV